MTARRGNTIAYPAGSYSTKTLAAKVGVSEDTIKRWRDAGLLPYTTRKAGRLDIYVYRRAALEAALALKAGTGPLADRVLRTAS